MTRNFGVFANRHHLRPRSIPSAAPMPGQSIERCGAAQEGSEKASGGNGITGHDETSEPLDVTFKLATMPTPGVKNGCP